MSEGVFQLTIAQESAFETHYLKAELTPGHSPSKGRISVSLRLFTQQTFMLLVSVVNAADTKVWLRT